MPAVKVHYAYVDKNIILNVKYRFRKFEQVRTAKSVSELYFCVDGLNCRFSRPVHVTVDPQDIGRLAAVRPVRRAGLRALMATSTADEHLAKQPYELLAEHGAEAEVDDGADHRVEHRQAFEGVHEEEVVRQLLDLLVHEDEGDVVGVVRRPAEAERDNDGDKHWDRLLFADEGDLAVARRHVARRMAVQPQLGRDAQVDASHDDHRDEELHDGEG